MPPHLMAKDQLRPGESRAWWSGQEESPGGWGQVGGSPREAAPGLGCWAGTDGHGSVNEHLSPVSRLWLGKPLHLCALSSPPRDWDSVCKRCRTGKEALKLVLEMAIITEPKPRSCCFCPSSVCSWRGLLCAWALRLGGLQHRQRSLSSWSYHPSRRDR